MHSSSVERFRRSPPVVFYKKKLLNIFWKIHGKALMIESYFTEVAG